MNWKNSARRYGAVSIAACYCLIGLHTAAVLFHHYIIKDDTLVRILPRKGQAAKYAVKTNS